MFFYRGLLFTFKVNFVFIFLCLWSTIPLQYRTCVLTILMLDIFAISIMSCFVCLNNFTVLFYVILCFLSILSLVLALLDVAEIKYNTSLEVLGIWNKVFSSTKTPNTKQSSIPLQHLSINNSWISNSFLTMMNKLQNNLTWNLSSSC